MKHPKTEKLYNCSPVQSEFFPSNYWEFSNYPIFCFKRKSFPYSKIFNLHHFAPLITSDKSSYSISRVNCQAFTCWATLKPSQRW